MPRRLWQQKHVDALPKPGVCPVATQVDGGERAVVILSSDDEDNDDYLVVENALLQESEIKGALDNIIK